MRIIAFVALCCLSLACKDRAPAPPDDGTAGPPGDAKTLIIGNWTMRESRTGWDERIEFTADGRAIARTKTKGGTNELTNTFKFLDANTVQFFEGDRPLEKYKIEAWPRALRLTNQKTYDADLYQRDP